MKLVIRSLVLATIAAASLTTLAGEQANPLHPSFFATKANVADRTGGSATDPRAQTMLFANNPLHPSYGQKQAPGIWTQTGRIILNPYVDHNNPLHPAFKRS